MIQSVRRALDILALFSYQKPSLGITEISRALNLPKGTVHGLAGTLTRQGYLEQDPESRKYRLGLKIFELGAIFAGTLEINQKAAAEIHQLAERTRQLVKLAVWDGRWSVLVTMSIQPISSNLEQLNQYFVPRLPAYCSALGKAILAFISPQDLRDYLDKTEFIAYTPRTITRKSLIMFDLEETRQRGYAVDQGEILLGTACLAAPIFDRTGRVAASVSLSAATDLLLGDRQAEFVEEVMKTGGDISRRMGYYPESMAGLEAVKAGRG